MTWKYPMDVIRTSKSAYKLAEAAGAAGEAFTGAST